MFARILAAILIVGLSAISRPATAQTTPECDREGISLQLADYAEQIVNATDTEIDSMRQEIDILLADYLAGCAEATETPAETTETPTETSTVLFTVVPTGNVNIRSCSATTCDIVETSTNGQVYNVIAEEDDWYEIELESGDTGFIASWLVTRGPDEVVDIYEGYFDGSVAKLVKEERYN